MKWIESIERLPAENGSYFFRSPKRSGTIRFTDGKWYLVGSYGEYFTIDACTWLDESDEVNDQDFIKWAEWIRDNRFIADKGMWYRLPDMKEYHTTTDLFKLYKSIQIPQLP